MRILKRQLSAIATTFLCMLLMFLLFSVKLSHGLSESARVALVPSPKGEAGNGGALPTNPPGGFPDGDTFTFVNLDPNSIATNATDPIVAGQFDTVVLVQLYFQNWWSNPTFSSRITSFVSNGGKLIIYDSEVTIENYSTFIYPFTVSAPGPQGSLNGKIWIVENNALGSNNTASASYVNTTTIGTQTEIGDANTMITYNSNWKTHMVATNTLSVTGPVHTYAEYGKGLIIWNGQDMDPFDYTPYENHPIDNANGPDAMGMMWYLELKQGFNPTNPPLPGSVSTAGLALVPGNATNPIETTHTVTARVTNNLGQAVPNVAVNFSITAGPNAGISGTSITSATGETTFSWSSTLAGTDTVTAYAKPFNVVIQAQAFKTWTGSGQTPQMRPNTQWWSLAIILASAMFVSITTTILAIILIADAARIRRKRKKK